MWVQPPGDVGQTPVGMGEALGYGVTPGEREVAVGLSAEPLGTLGESW